MQHNGWAVDLREHLPHDQLVYRGDAGLKGAWGDAGPDDPYNLVRRLRFGSA